MLGKITALVDNSDNTVSRSTGSSPNMLLYGVEQRGLVVDYLTEYLSFIKEDARIDLGVMRKDAADNITKIQDYANQWYNSKGARQYHTGDLVYIQNVDTSPGNKKFIAKFKGPYKVVKIIPHDRYVIGDVEGMQVSQIPYDGVKEARNIRLWKEYVSEK